MHDRFSEVSHQADQGGVPFVGDLGESSRATGHQNLAHTVLESLDAFLVHSDEGLSGNLLGALILQLPDSIFLRELFLSGPLLRKDSHFKATHVEQ